MSAESVARWNAIPMARPAQNEEEQHVHLKRSRSDQGDDSEDDNVSLVSPTPSPPPGDAVGKYGEHAHEAPREVITVETKIKNTNKGFAMLQKLGWSEGQPLGLSQDGRVDPIPFHVKNDLTGLGKITQDVRMIETTVSQRRELDSERQRKETQDQRKAREDIVAKRAALKSEITDTLRPFYCTLCEKQFQNVAQYDEHTNSYAHHHKARLKDMQANARLVNQGELEKRKEKERKREEKELRKLAKAQGIKIAKPATATPASVLPSDNGNGTTTVNETKSAAFRNAGWAAVTTVPQPPDIDSTSSGWAADSPASLLPGDTTPAAPPASRSPPVSAAPIFRTGGWTSLESSTFRSVAPLPTPPEPSAPPPPPPTLPQRPVSVPDSRPSPQSQPSSSVAPTRSGWQQWKQGNSSKRR